MNTVFENGMFWRLIFFHIEILKYKEAVLAKYDKAKLKEEREEEKKKKLVKRNVLYLIFKLND